MNVARFFKNTNLLRTVTLGHKVWSAKRQIKN